MHLLLDTNILIAIARSRNVNGLMQFINPENSAIYISVVSEAEIRSFAIKNKWGVNRLTALGNFLDQLRIVDIDQSHVATYAEIDSFSQRLSPAFADYHFNTPRNMGKNDLWIASLAALLGLTLITTDSDFDHLHDVFFGVRKIKPAELAAFL